MDLASELSALRQRAEGLLQRADVLKAQKNVAGVGKVKKRIQAEIAFIKSVRDEYNEYRCMNDNEF